MRAVKLCVVFSADDKEFVRVESKALHNFVCNALRTMPAIETVETEASVHKKTTESVMFEHLLLL